jgi:tRNA threonylcarbamoyladenosine biosynthesis protein TsaB
MTDSAGSGGLLLAVDLSTATGSMALFDGAAILGEYTWEDGVRGHTRLVQACTEFLGKTGCRADDIAAFAVGIGPGSFSGLRSSIAFVQGLALPGGRRVIGVESSAALALTTGERTGAAVIAVVGDARRGRFWAGVYAVEEGVVRTVEPVALKGPEAMRGILADARIAVVSPDRARLGDALKALDGGAEVLPGDAKPSAAAVGRIALRRPAGAAAEAVRPVYLHPPVFVAPRFGG